MRVRDYRHVASCGSHGRLHRRQAPELGRAAASRGEILAYFERQVAKWQVSDDEAFVEAIPLGPTGKMLKSRLREQFRE